jgi:hypothetical protein
MPHRICRGPPICSTGASARSRGGAPRRRQGWRSTALRVVGASTSAGRPSLRSGSSARAPDAAARAYLTVIAREPGLVAAALSSRGGGRAMRVSELAAALDESQGR